jgi:nitroimidazol reductase NimA-like FMN-containing flavoprotein (pyridoxamine 5'-phosphate oxidase superfamily)
MFREPRGSVLGNEQLTEKEIEEVFARCPYGTLATIGENGYPAVTPVNVAYRAGTVYFHSGDRGEKMENIRRNPNVSINVFEPADDIGQQRISAHRSVTIYGKAEILDEAEAVEALKAIALAAGMPFKAEDSYILPRQRGIAAVRIRPEHMTGRVVKFGGIDGRKKP